MVSIYALVDPRNNKPFYVGATIDPLVRFNEHKAFNEISQFYENPDSVLVMKNKKVRGIYKSGRELKMVILAVVEFDDVDKTEKMFYNAFINLGFKMTQSGGNFCWQKKNKHLYDS